MKKSVVVVGAGIAGLTAAHKLKKSGVEVLVLEAADRVGGAISSISENGYLAELGPNTILETSPRVTELVKELGIDSQKVYADSASDNRYIVRDKKAMVLPTSPIKFLTTSMFGWKTKLGLLREPFLPAWDNRYEESLAQFVVRRLTQEFLDYAINPFVAGVFAGEPEHISVKHGFRRLYALEQKYGSLIKGQIKGAKERKRSEEKSKQTAKMFSFRNGLKTLPEALAAHLNGKVLTKATVENISNKSRGWEVTYRTRERAHEAVRCDQILYAGPAYKLKEINVDGKAVNEFSVFERIYHPPVSTLTLGFRREDVSHPLDGFGVLIPKVENFSILGALFSSSLFPGRSPSGHVSVTVFIGGTRQPENGSKPLNELIAISLHDLGIILGVQGNPVFVHHTFWPKAIPQYEVGYGKYKDTIDHLELKYPGLHFSGNYRNGISVADTIVNALEISERMLVQC
jgi:oxygen-dependent protoporphyrinogen oxidase